jgi:hypothetical protein
VRFRYRSRLVRVERTCMLQPTRREQGCRHVFGENDQQAHHALMLVQVRCTIVSGPLWV